MVKDDTTPEMSSPSDLSVGDAEGRLRRFAGARVLLAEDDAVNQEVARGLLEDLGLLVDVADDGAVALARVPGGAYAVVLMDLQMPVMDGLEATRQIRRLPEGARIPILAMTASAFADDRARCFDAGMNEVIIKPVDPALLFETLACWLERGGV